MSWLTTGLLGTAISAGGIGVFRTIDNRVSNVASNNQCQGNNGQAGGTKKDTAKKKREPMPPIASTAISSAALALTGTANQIYSKHRMNEIKSAWTTSVVDEGKVECSSKLIESLTDEELVRVLQANGLLDEDTSVDVKTI